MPSHYRRRSRISRRRKRPGPRKWYPSKRQLRGVKPGALSILPSTIVAPTGVMKMKSWNDEDESSGSTSASRTLGSVVNLNSIVLPFVGGKKALGTDQLAGLYDRATVLGGTLKVSWEPSVYFGVYPKGVWIRIAIYTDVQGEPDLPTTDEEKVLLKPKKAGQQIKWLKLPLRPYNNDAYSTNAGTPGTFSATMKFSVPKAFGVDFKSVINDGKLSDAATDTYSTTFSSATGLHKLSCKVSLLNGQLGTSFGLAADSGGKLTYHLTQEVFLSRRDTLAMS